MGCFDEEALVFYDSDGLKLESITHPVVSRHDSLGGLGGDVGRVGREER
jgi:hypothetical protein